MTLDLFSVSVMTAAVVLIVGVIYVSETLIRRDEVSGRHWSIAFLAGILTTVAYAVWAAGGGWIAVAAGNAAFVAATGFIWIGCRSYNGHRIGWAYVTVGIGMTIAFVAVAAAGPNGGDWAGVVWMYATLSVLASLGVWETGRGRLAQTRTTIALGVVLAVEAVYTAVRAIAFLMLGPDDPVFQAWFSTIPSSFVTIALVITAAIVTSILRAGRAGTRGYTNLVGADGADRILTEPQFRATITDVLERASEKGIGVGVIAMRIDDLPFIAKAFGNEVGRNVAVAARDAVRRTVEPLAVIGDDGATLLWVCDTAWDANEARRQASRLASAVFEALRTVPDSVVPVVGIGVAVTHDFGYDACTLIDAADAASTRSAKSGDISVLIAEPSQANPTGAIALVSPGSATPVVSGSTTPDTPTAAPAGS